MSVYFPRCNVTIGAVIENLSVSKPKQSFQAIPLSISVQRNSYNQADSWSIELDAKDFPIPPALIRAASVRIDLFNDNGSLATSDPVIHGIVDEVEMNWSDSGRILRLDGQDYTALFLEHQFKKGKGGKKAFGQPLHKVMYQLMREVDITEEMRLVVGDTVYVPKENNVSSPKFGTALSKTNKKGFPVKRGDSYWDYMYKVALKHGYILYVNGLDLVLTTPQTVYKPNTLSRVYSMAWGENIEELSMTRRMGKERVPQVEVRSYDSESGKVKVAKFPKDGTIVSTGLGTKRDEIVTHVVYGVKDEIELARFAETAYNLMARTEQIVNIRTSDMEDSMGKDLIAIRTGDAVYLKFNAFNTEYLYGKDWSGAKVAKWLVERGFNRQVANLLGNNYQTLARFTSPFYLKEADITWNAESGFSMGATLINFVSKNGQPETGKIKGAAEVI